MKTLGLCFLLPCFAFAVACSGGADTTTGDDGGSPDASIKTTDGGSNVDATLTTDGAPSNGDGGGGVNDIKCEQLGGKYDDAKACQTVDDCTTIARGCFCGAQPVIGIAKAFEASATSCETKVGNQCALGCPNAPGQTAEDGKNTEDGGTIEVRCDNSKCHTILQ